MTDIQIKNFLAVGQTLNITKAAERLYITQPALTKQLNSLEKELGVRLFGRSSKGLQFTPAGKIYYDYFERISKEYNEISTQIQIMGANTILSLKIGFLEDWNISGFFLKLKEALSEFHLGTDFSMHSHGIKKLIYELKSQKLDLIIILNTALDGIPDIEIKTLEYVSHVLLYSAAHPLANKRDVIPQDFKNDIFFVIGEDESKEASNYVRDFCKPYGFVPKIKLVDNIWSIIANVENGLGVTVADSWFREINHVGFKHVELNATLRVVVAWNKNHTNPAVSFFVDALSNLV